MTLGHETSTLLNTSCRPAPYEQNTCLDGSAEKLTEYQSEVVWFEQSFKPSERTQLVARLFKALLLEIL